MALMSLKEARAATPLFAALIALWEARRPATDRPPGRDGLSPAELMRYLPLLAMAERDPDGSVRLAWAGTGIKERLGGDPSGRALEDLLGPGTETAFAMIAEDGVPVGLADGRTVGGTDVRALLLPLAGAGGAIDAALVAVAW
ncbi:MAG: PAS domain-containing protein [Azospirillaceae bacterium]